MLLASVVVAALPLATPAWDDLVPWRTWVVADHVGDPRHWFVVDAAPGGGQRCEVSVPAGQGMTGGAIPQVWCGGATLGPASARPVEGPVRKARRAARDALLGHLGVDAAELPVQALVYRGTLTRVSFRQIVPMASVADHGGELGVVPTRTVKASWDVAADGEVVPGAVSPEARVAALCAPGFDPGCDRAPVVLAYQPPAGWEGRLVTGTGPGMEPAVSALRAAVRGATMASRAEPLREVTGGVLPDAHDETLLVQLHLQAEGPGGPVGDGQFEVGLSLRAAQRAPVTARLPVTGVPAAVEFTVDLAAGSLAVRVQPEDDRYIEQVFPLRCDLLVDGDAVALPRPCDVGSDGRWLRWSGPSGMVMVQVAPLAGASLEGTPAASMQARSLHE